MIVRHPPGVDNAPVNAKQGPTGMRAVVVIGLGVVGMIWLSTTSWGGGLVIAFLVAAIVYQAVSGGGVQTFLKWLNG